MTDREPWAAVKQRLLSSGKTDFASLVKLAGLDPARHMRFAEWSGADFSGSDLRGFDFTGARLIGCNFKGARIEGARFDQALIDEARPGTKLDPAPHLSPGRKRLENTLKVGRGQISPRRSICRRARCFRMRLLLRKWL